MEEHYLVRLNQIMKVIKSIIKLVIVIVIRGWFAMEAAAVY